MEKLAIFKVVQDGLELCGYFDNKDEAMKYLAEIKKIMDDKFQHQLRGEYLAIPVLYFNIQQTKTEQPK